MTYCLAIKVHDGLVCLADGRLTSGTQVTQARKASRHQTAGGEVCIMTSGLRSLRDKTLARYDRALDQAKSDGCGSLLDAVEIYSRCLRDVAEEDRESLERSKLSFNLHSILAGQIGRDREPSLFLVYPEANWIEVGPRSPYLAVGATAYGKPILDRALTIESSLETALKLAYLSFDSTRFSSSDVGFPLDVITFAASDRTWREAHYDYDDMTDQRNWWNEQLTKLAREMPDGPWIQPLVPGARLTLVKDES